MTGEAEPLGDQGCTTIKVSHRVAWYIHVKAVGNESVDTTLRRLLGMIPEEEPPVKKVASLTTLKVSRVVMDRIAKEAKKDESRDETLARLIGLPVKKVKK